MLWTTVHEDNGAGHDALDLDDCASEDGHELRSYFSFSCVDVNVREGCMGSSYPWIRTVPDRGCRIVYVKHSNNQRVVFILM